MLDLSSLDPHLLAQVQSFLSPRGRARLEAVDTERRRAAREAQLGQQGDDYYQQAHANCFPGHPRAADNPSGPTPAWPRQAAAAFRSDQQASHAALGRLRARARSLAEFVAEVGALEAPLSRRYAYVPAAHHGMDLWAVVAAPVPAGASPPRPSAHAVAAARAAIQRFLDQACPHAPGLAAARQRLAALPSPSLQLPTDDARRSPPPAPGRSGVRRRAEPWPPAGAPRSTRVRRTLAEAFEDSLHRDENAEGKDQIT